MLRGREVIASSDNFEGCGCDEGGAGTAVEEVLALLSV